MSARIFYPEIMTRQYSLLDEAGDQNERAGERIEGFRYRPKIISGAEQNQLLAYVRLLPFKEFEFHGYKGKRRTVSFGWQYEFSGRGALKKAGDIPDFLLTLRARAAKFSGIKSEDLQHVLVIEYGPGAGIGWHRDKPVFADVIGVSLLAPCVLRFRRPVDGFPRGIIGPREKKAPGNRWQRANVIAEPGSAYLLSGPARSEWQHSILRVEQLRYSITFRSMLESVLDAA